MVKISDKPKGQIYSYKDGFYKDGNFKAEGSFTQQS